MTGRRAVAALSASALALGVLVAVGVGSAPAGAATGTPVHGRRVIGYSVKHRPIVAYHLGNPDSRKKVVLVGQMHGDEHAGVTVANALVHGRSTVEGMDLWVIPTMNPDGDRRHTRQNAHHVDLNRNWPDHFAHLTGEYYSGRRPRSEPETRAMYTFLRRMRPKYLIVLHQPLHGVDTTDGGALDVGLTKRLARNLGLPRKPFRCWSFCHGSMTGWYTTHRYGIADTIEFGWHPTTRYLTGRVKRGIITALGGHFGSISGHDPRSTLAVSTSVGHARLSGWAYDIDARSSSLLYRAYRDGVRVLTARTDITDAALNRSRRLRGRHAFAFTIAVRPGRHTFCTITANTGAGRSNPKHCVTRTVPGPPPA